MEKELIIQPKLQNQDWYQEMLEEAKATIVQTRFESNVRLLEGKWHVGKLIFENELNFQRAGYGERIVETIAKDLQMSSQGLWKCVQFYKKFPEADFSLVPGKLSGIPKLTWFEVCKSVLPSKKREPKEKPTCEHKEFTCSCCKVKFNLAQIKEMLSEQL
jgi:hypothetical protein